MEKIIKNIKENKKEKNKDALDAIVSKLNTFEKSELLSHICDLIYEEKYRSDDIEYLLERFDKDEDLDKVVITICREFLTDRDTIKYIVQNSQNLSNIIYMLTVLFDEKRNSSYQMIAENLLYCYDYDLTNKDINSLLSNLEEYDSDTRDYETDDIACYLKNKRVFDRESYKKPYWVSLQEGENIGLLATVPLGISESEDEEVKFDKLINSYSSFFYQLLPKKERYGEDTSIFSINDLPENIQRSIQVFLNASTEYESKESKTKIGTSDRVWGPKNSIPGKECASGPDGKGPCRMLQCECLDLDEDDNNDIYENEGEVTWFKGKCDGCGDFIPDLSHALRFPHRNGGWVGCYCSFDCMVNHPPDQICKEENILLGIMKENIDRYGIMDRSSFC
jgi:hypothetical protein